MFRLIFKILEAIFAIIGLLCAAIIVLWIYYCPLDLDYLKGRFNLNYIYTQTQESPIQYEHENITVHKEKKWTFSLSNWINSIITDLWEMEITPASWDVSYIAYFYNPDYNTIFHPAKFVFADKWNLWEDRDFQCLKILNNNESQDNPNNCKIFTINSGFFWATQDYKKLYITVTPNTDWTEITIE